MAGSLLRFPGSRSASERYSHDLQSIYGFDHVIDDPDLALAYDDEVLDKVARDPVLKSAILQRQHAIAGSDWHIEPPTDEPKDKAGADIIEELIDKIRRFSAARYTLAAFFLRGRTYAYCRTRRQKTSIAGTRPQDWLICHRIEDIDKRRVRKEVRTENGRREIVNRIWSIENDRWLDIPEHAWQAVLQPVYQDREERLGYGEGLIVPMYFYFRAKEIIWREVLGGLERWSRGIVAAKVDLERKGDTDKTNEDVQDEWLDVIDKMRSRHALVYGDGDEFQVFESSGSGYEMGQNLLDYVDKTLYRLVTGSVRPGGLDTDTGARAQAETEQETTDILLQYDRKQLDEEMTDTLIKLLWNQNRAQLQAIGLGDAAMPRFVTAKERREKVSEVVTTIQTALASGVPLAKTEVYERLGFRMPAEQEEVFEGVEQVPTAGGFPFPGGA